MCGIAAIFAYSDNASAVDREELLRVRESMWKRGPDGDGLWVSEDRRIGLAHRRLAIIDLAETGSQPMATPDGILRVVFNGEIYNYRELRQRLESKGYEFRSKSDTEVLLYLYQEYRDEVVEHLRGMYAFAIYDLKSRELFLARDPHGIKPLYYADDGSTIRVASQVKALLKGGHIDTAPDPAGRVGFYLWGHVPEPYTMYRQIRALPAGTTLSINESRKQARQFFSLTNELAKAGNTALVITPQDMHERLRAGLLDTVRNHLIADVPVGVFLSAGIDSGTLTALAVEGRTTDLRTVTLGFKEFEGTTADEVPLASLAAKHYGTRHHTAWITKQDFQKERDAILEAMDQPSIDGVNTYFVSKAAAEAGLKVALSGLGGDELLGGYGSFQQIPRMVKCFSPFGAFPFLAQGVRYLSAPILKHFTSPKYAGLLEYGGTYGGAYLLRRGMFMPWELPELLDGEIVREGWNELQTLARLERTAQRTKNARLKVTALEMSWYMRNQLLRDADWAGMAHSLEIRVPFVDIPVQKTVARLIDSNQPPTKLDMAQTPQRVLPAPLTRRKKTNFSVPVAQWLMTEFNAFPKDRGLRGWARVLGHQA